MTQLFIFSLGTQLKKLIAKRKNHRKGLPTNSREYDRMFNPNIQLKKPHKAYQNNT
jgi:hypothetical protein